MSVARFPKLSTVVCGLIIASTLMRSSGPSITSVCLCRASKVCASTRTDRSMVGQNQKWCQEFVSF